MGFTYKIRAQATAATIALSAVLFGFAGVANAAAGPYSITCGSVSIVGTVWTMTGTWSALDYSGQSSDYDVSLYSPSATLISLSAKTSPDSFVITTPPGANTNYADGPQDDMHGTWTHVYDFGVTSPASISAKLYHGQVGGHESSVESSCTFTLPTRLTLHKTVVNNDFGTAANTAWTLTATKGATTISGTDGSNAVTNAIVATGTWTLGETGGPSGYTNGTYSCSKNGGAPVVSNTITLAAGDNAVCTVTNNDVAGATVTITKTAVGGDGIFSFTGTGSIGGFTITTIGGTGSKSFTVNPFTGPYTITETDPTPAWDITADTCSGLAVSSGATTNCGITNTKRGSITVHKDVVAPDGTTDVADTHGFTVTLDDANPHAVSESASYTYANLVPGTYTVAEDADANYDLVSITNGGSISVGAGQDVDVYVVNKQKKGHLTVVKHVANHGIGSSAAGDFTIKVVDANGHEQSFAGAEAGTAIDIDPGAYDVSETGPSGYAMTLSGCGTAMASNGSATCTVTNSDIPTGQGAITVIKDFINDNGGSALASAFNAYLKITPEGDAAFAVNSGAANFLDAGNYTVSEDDTTLLNYTLHSISCTDVDATNGGAIALADQAAWVCTVTNDDIAPSLTLVKQVTNDDGGEAVATDWTLTATGPSTISGAGGAESGATFQAGTYTLSESAGPAGYTAGTWSCTNDVTVGEGNTITLGIGQSTTCTIVNDDQPGTLHIVKHVINDNGGTKTANDFSFKVNNGEPTAFTQDGENALLGQNDVVLPAGTYTVTEVAVDGYGSSSQGCSNIELTNGGEATCTFTNNDGQATLTLVKNTSGADGTFDFSLVAGEFSTTSEVSTVEGTGSTDISVDAGTYDITENIPAGWTLSDRFCYVYNTESNAGEGIQNGMAVTLSAGDHIVCTFDNTATGADLSVDKTVDDTTPDQNQNVTYTLTAHNAGPAAIAGVEVTDVLPAGLEFVSADGDYATTTGIWTIGTLTAGSTTTMHIVAKVTGAKGSAIENGATISGNDEGISDYNEENDADTVGVTVNNPATPPSGGGGGGGGNGPIVGSLGGGGGQVLGISTSTPFGAACEKYLFKFIKYGSKTNDPEQVKRLQYVLGVLEGYNVPQNGVFDKATYDAVHAFQTKYGDKVLTPWGLSHSTGYVYLTTRKMVNEVYCKGASFPLTAEEQKIVDDYRARGNAGGAPAAPKQTPAPVAPAAPKQPEATAPVQDAGTVNVELPGTTGTGDEAQAGAAATPAPTTSVIDRIKNFFGGLFH